MTTSATSWGVGDHDNVRSPRDLGHSGAHAVVAEAVYARMEAPVRGPEYPQTGRLRHAEFPFPDIGGKYMIHSSQISDAALSGLDWKQIANNIGNNGSTLGERIDGSAGALVAYMCAVTDDKPSSVCRAVANAEAPVMTPPTPGANSHSG
jgi:hypothetical protein